MARVGMKTKAMGALLGMVLVSCGGEAAVTTTSAPSSTSSTASGTTTTTGNGGTTATSDPGGTTGTASGTTTSAADTTTTLASGPFGSAVSTEGVTAQLSYSLATPGDICTGFTDDPASPSIEFQDGASVTVGSVVFICFPGFAGFEEVRITPPGAGTTLAFMNQRNGTNYVPWTVLPGDPQGTYTVSATPAGQDGSSGEETTSTLPEEEPTALEATFTVSPATTPGLRVVDPAEQRWLQPEWPGRDDVAGDISLAYFGIPGTVTIDIYADPEINEVEAGYVGSLSLTAESGGAGIVTLPGGAEEGFFCFSIRSQTQTCDAAVQLFQ